MRLLFIGDIVGRAGRSMLEEWMPKLKKKYQPNLIIINGENASGGRGLTKKIARSFFELGVHAITMGNHTWDQKEIFDFINQESNIIRPANYPEGTPGQGFTYIRYNTYEIGIINLMGRTFLPPLDCPFKKADEILKEMKKRTKFIFVDFHAEATSEKQALGWYLDGQVSAVVGTHTHVQTADERILPNGTAYITDVGMTGPYDGILGMEKEGVLYRFLTQLPSRFEVASGRTQLGAVVIDLHKETGKAVRVERIRIDDDQKYQIEL